MSQVEDIAVSLRWKISKIIRVQAPFLTEQYAESLAAAVMDGLRLEYGGDRLYIPSPEKARRDEAIRREFNGRNRKEVCGKYGVSKSRLYEILGQD